MNPIEALRWLSEDDWLSPKELVLGELELLLGLCRDRAAMVAAVKRLLQARPEMVELWVVANSILGSMDLSGEIGEIYGFFAAHIESCDLHDAAANSAEYRRYSSYSPLAILPSEAVIPGEDLDLFSSVEIHSCSWKGLSDRIGKRYLQENRSSVLHFVSVEIPEDAVLKLDGTPQGIPLYFGEDIEELLAPFPARLGASGKTQRRRGSWR
ncbi:MAG: hypothetical protein HKL81_02180 [Acidimicrobiaceae bacterium]|nr:hypothetical protein [Acidimicrobiaceae bacterium]